MEIYLKRLFHTDNLTIGVLYFSEDKPFGWILEDEPRKEKIKGETRIPSGRYKLGIRKELTPLTRRCRQSSNYAGWFEYFIEVMDVPNFSNIYFHIGNTEKDTSGCQIGGISCSLNGEITVINSTKFNKEFYSIVYPRLKKGEDVYYNIIDEK